MHFYCVLLSFDVFAKQLIDGEQCVTEGGEGSEGMLDMYIEHEMLTITDFVVSFSIYDQT